MTLVAVRLPEKILVKIRKMECDRHSGLFLTRSRSLALRSKIRKSQRSKECGRLQANLTPKESEVVLDTPRQDWGALDTKEAEVVLGIPHQDWGALESGVSPDTARDADRVPLTIRQVLKLPRNIANQNRFPPTVIELIEQAEDHPYT